MQRDNLLGNTIQILMILVAIIIMYLGGLKFLIISIIFYLSGGFYEFIIMNKFQSIGNERITKKDSITKKMRNGFMWVHNIMLFRKKYNLTIYDFKKIGQLPSFISYLVMNIYILISYILFINFSYMGFTVYLIPFISNVTSFLTNSYHIKNN